MACADQTAIEIEKSAKYCAVSTASWCLKAPPRKRSMMGNDSATIQELASSAVASTRDTARFTPVANSHSLPCVNSEEKKGSEAAPAADPIIVMGTLKRFLATVSREMPPGAAEA